MSPTPERIELATRIAHQQAWLAAASALMAARQAGDLDRAAYRRRLADLHAQGASVRFLAAATGMPRSTVHDDVQAGRHIADGQVA